MSQDTKKSGIKPRNKLSLLGLSIFLIAGLASWGWFWGAGQLQTVIEDKIQVLSKRGKTITCGDLDIRGFPFRVGVYCERTALDDDQKRLGLTAGELRTAAQIYRPGHIISELDGPLTITTKTNQIEARWNNLQASTVVDLSKLDRASIIATEPNIDLKITEFRSLAKVKAKDVKIHLRQNGADLDLALSSVDLEMLNRKGRQFLPKAQFELVSTVLEKGYFLNHSEPQSNLSLRNSDLTLHGLSLAMENQTSILLKGPLKISPNGLVSGELDVTLTNLPGAEPIVRKLRPDLARNFDNIVNILSALNQSGSGDEIKIKVTLKNGAASAGLIPLGIIPPVF